MAMQKMQNPNNLAALLEGGSSLLSLFAPKKKTVGGQTETTATNMSMEGLDAVLRQILESNQGLASVARGQRQAGLYNTTANTLLTNDLITRASGEVAKINAPTTRTTSGRSDREEAPIGIGSALQAIAGGTLLNKALKSDTAKKAGNSILDAVTGKAGKVASGFTSGFDLPMGDLGTLGSSWTSGFDLGGDLSSGAGWTSGFDLGGLDSLSGAGGVSPLGIANSIYNIFSSNDKGAAAETAIGTAVGQYFGGPVGAFIGGKVAEPVFEAGYDILGSAKDAIGDVFKSVGCFITTAVVDILGKPDDCEELQTLRAFRDSWLKENHPEDIEIYYDVAPKILDKLSTMPEAEELLKAAYVTNILPSVEAIKQNENEVAYSLYRDMVMRLSKAAGLDTEKETS